MSTIAIKFIAAVYRSGTSHKTGTPKPFEFGLLHYAATVETRNTDNFKQHGYGAEPKQLPMDVAMIEQFKDCQFGDLVDIQVGVDPDDLQRVVIEKVLGPSSAKPAAPKAADTSPSLKP
ncbi:MULTISPECIES: hypothetical protein [Gammaproteobacteria]|uniref:hypothetical protein n=1 Tax=Gammaproteobacteria TaxID=1236 RepID=UPI003A91CC3C